jgi:hypothetical protein
MLADPGIFSNSKLEETAVSSLCGVTLAAFTALRTTAARRSDQI